MSEHTTEQSCPQFPYCALLVYVRCRNSRLQCLDFRDGKMQGSVCLKSLRYSVSADWFAVFCTSLKRHRGSRKISRRCVVNLITKCDSPGVQIENVIPYENHLPTSWKFRISRSSYMLRGRIFRTNNKRMLFNTAGSPQKGLITPGASTD